MPTRTQRNLKRLFAIGGVAALTTIGVLLPTSAQAQILTYTTNENANFYCWSNCEAGGVGHVDDQLSVTTYPINYPAIGRWTRSFRAECKFNTSGGVRYFRGTVADKNWKGTWEVAQRDIIGGNYDGRLEWCR